MSDTGAVARAFVLAASGKFANIDEVRRQLKSEGFSNVEGHTAGSSITKQLRAIMGKATIKRVA